MLDMPARVWGQGSEGKVGVRLGLWLGSGLGLGSGLLVVVRVRVRVGMSLLSVAIKRGFHNYR